MNDQNKKDKKTYLPTQAMLILRGSIGVYLMYLAYELFRDESKVAPRMIVIVFSIVFMVAGAIIFVGIIRKYIRGEYVGGKADTSNEEEYTEYEEEFTEDIAGEEIAALEASNVEEKEE